MSRRDGDREGGWRAQWPFTCPGCDQAGAKNEHIIMQRGVAWHVACWSREHE